MPNECPSSPVPAISSKKETSLLILRPLAIAANHHPQCPDACIPNNQCQRKRCYMNIHTRQTLQLLQKRKLLAHPPPINTVIAASLMCFLSVFLPVRPQRHFPPDSLSFAFSRFKRTAAATCALLRVALFCSVCSFSSCHIHFNAPGRTSSS